MGDFHVIGAGAGMATVSRLRGAPDAEGVLNKVADDGLVLATSGGSDWVCPSTTAVAVPGGYRLDGRKQFCSQAPVAGVISTSATVGEPGPDAVVLHAGVPLSAAGVSIPAAPRP